MIDTHICKEEYIYQFRVDLKEEQFNEIMTFMKKYEIPYYLGSFEVGAQTKKAHFQGVLWSNKYFSQNEKAKMRQNLKKLECLAHRNSISITDAKKPESLCKYVLKTKAKCYTNLSKEQVTLIGTWETEKDNKSKIYEHMKKWVQENNHQYLEEHINEYTGYNKIETKVSENEFVREYFKYYKEVMTSYPTSRNKWTIWKLMLELQVVPLERYIEECRIL